MSAKILLADIETAPAQVFVFDLRNQNIGLPQIIEPDRMIAFGAKWLGKSGVQFYSEYHDDRITMLEKIRDLLDECDILVSYNGKRFDTPWIRAELKREKIEQPSPFKQIDLYSVGKANMRFISHKLDFLAWSILKDSKVSHTGFKLWRDCLIGTPEEKRKAWALMKRYCKHDVTLLEPLFHELQEFFPATMNLAVYEGPEGEDGELRCAKCGKTEFLGPRGFAYTSQRAYPQHYCYPERGGCGGWTRDVKSSWGISTAGVVR